MNVTRTPATPTSVPTTPPRKTSPAQEGFAAALEEVTAKQEVIGKLKMAKLPCTIAEMKEAYQRAMDAFRQKFDAFLKEAGIDTSKPIKFQVGYDGRPFVSNDHPDKVKIQNFLEKNPGVATDLHNAIAFRGHLESMEEAIAFQEAYRKDPKTAVAKFSYLFNNSREVFFDLLVSGNGYEFEKHTRMKPGTL